MADIDSLKLDEKDQDEPEAVPFFARFLEDQKRIRTGVKAGGGGCNTTAKYPSDNDENVTLKFPSDNEEGGV